MTKLTEYKDMGPRAKAVVGGHRPAAILPTSITANQCDYCIASHGAMARAKGMTEEMHEEFMAVVLAAQKSNKMAVAYRVPVDAAFEET